MQSNRIRGLIAIAVSAFAVLFVVVGMVYPQAVPLFGLNDRLAHGLVFCALTMLLLVLHPLRVSVSLAIGIGLALLTELAQLLIPLRQADAIDLVANLIGIVIAYAFRRLFPILLDRGNWPQKR